MFRVHAASQHDSCTNVQNINFKKKKRRSFSFQAYQVQMKHDLIFYILRLRLLEQYFNVWHNDSQVF